MENETCFRRNFTGLNVRHRVVYRKGESRDTFAGRCFKCTFCEESQFSSGHQSFRVVETFLFRLHNGHTTPLVVLSIQS